MEISSKDDDKEKQQIMTVGIRNVLKNGGNIKY